MVETADKTFDRVATRHWRGGGRHNDHHDQNHHFDDQHHLITIVPMIATIK